MVILLAIKVHQAASSDVLLIKAVYSGVPNRARDLANHCYKVLPKPLLHLSLSETLYL